MFMTDVDSYVHLFPGSTPDLYLVLEVQSFYWKWDYFPGNKQDFTQSRMCCVEHTVPLDGEPAEQQ